MSFVFSLIVFLIIDKVTRIPELPRDIVRRFALFVMFYSIASPFAFCTDGYPHYEHLGIYIIDVVFIYGPICFIAQWIIIFLIDFIGISRMETRIAAFSFACFLIAYLTCSDGIVLPFLLSVFPAISVTIYPHVFTGAGRQYWRDTGSDFVYFIYVCFGFWDKDGICRTLFQVDEKVKKFNSTAPIPVSRGHYVMKECSKDDLERESKSDQPELEEPVEQEESYHYFSSIISSTIGTRVLLFMIFKYLTPLALYIRYTCPFPIFVHDKKLLAR